MAKTAIVIQRLRFLPGRKKTPMIASAGTASGHGEFFEVAAAVVLAV